MSTLRVALCQLNPTVGDLDGNVALVVEALALAERAGADLAVFPELVVTGYPPEDLLLKPGFVDDNREALDKIAAAATGCTAVVGFVGRSGADLHNAAAVCVGGGVQAVYRKRLLPNYGVFDERRYFTPGPDEACVVEVAGRRVGVTICEDGWEHGGPMVTAARAGADVLVSMNGSPYHADRLAGREQVLVDRATETGLPIVYVNQVGGQDELVFDGASLVLDADGTVRARAPQFEADVLVVDVPSPGDAPAPPEPLDRCAEIYAALVTGTRDYVTKNGFTDVVLGLSGGIDSSLVTTVAVDSVGPDRVHAIALPSRFSTEHSITDAERLCENLGVALETIAIEPAHAALLDMLAPSFSGLPHDVTEENIQGRIRAAVLMAFANKFRGWLVLICGNKSELAVGYTTVYGVDMAGGFAVIKDVPKTLVYELARWRNTRGPAIPEAVLTKAPSAELRPDQRDDQNLPPYDVLDPIVEAYVEHDQTAGELIAAGHDPDLVRRITRLIDVAEWKRRQAPVGVRITPKAFGRDRRMPITNRYRG